VDTAFFDTKFKQTLLGSFDSIDSELNGLLIKGDNFQVVNLLQDRYGSSLHTIYIDPPYNTEYDREVGNFIYKDSYDQSCWASMMADRLRMSRRLLASHGSFISSIDDNQVAILRLMGDEIFGRKNFVSNIAWKSRDSVSSDHIISRNHNYHLVYAKEIEGSNFGGYPLDADDYSNPDNDPRGPWKPVPLDANKPGGDTNYPIRNPNNGKDYYPPTGRSWAINSTDYQKLYDDNRIAFGKKGMSAPKRKLFYKERLDKDDFNTPISIWADAETTKEGTTQLENLFGEKVFSYPKPIGLLKDLIRIANRDRGSVVMDFFAGSGTTGHAVISINRDEGDQRRYILAEMGEYFETVLKPRIAKAIYAREWSDGKPMDKQGLSQLVKYSNLESYEDSLSNISFQKPSGLQQSVLDESHSLREDYILRYMLDAESSGSPTRLNNEQFGDPFSYQIETVDGGETRLAKVDLPETFNWLLGLTVEKIRFIEGFQTVEGTDPIGKRVLVIWRNLTDERHSNEQLENFLKEQGYLDRPTESVPNHIYVNGDCTLSSLKTTGQSWHVHLTEEAFRRLMFDTAEGGQ
jgi:adenine-specific DNA-methyltransferase